MRLTTFVLDWLKRFSLKSPRIIAGMFVAEAYASILDNMTASACEGILGDLYNNNTCSLFLLGKVKVVATASKPLDTNVCERSFCVSLETDHSTTFVTVTSDSHLII